MTRSGVSRAQRLRIAARANHQCEYCRTPSEFSADSLSVEHVVPRVEGGADSDDNPALACQGCNSRKSTKMQALDPVTGETTPLFHPRRHRWDDHFQWSDDYLYVIGRTPAGRASVATLKMNRVGLVNLRRILFLAGEHPPGEMREL
jgi:hypothetical protein